jgi:hypothetical protein
MISLSKEKISKTADCISKIIITFLSTIFIPLWLNADNKIGLDNYIGDHSFKVPWKLLMMLMPLFFLASYYALYLHTRDTKRCSPKMALIARIVICFFVFMPAAYFLIELTQFPGIFDKTEFMSVLFTFLGLSFFGIIVAIDTFIKNELEEFIDSKIRLINKILKF